MLSIAVNSFGEPLLRDGSLLTGKRAVPCAKEEKAFGRLDVCIFCCLRRSVANNDRFFSVDSMQKQGKAY